MTLELIKYQMSSGHVRGFEMFAVLLHEKRLVQTVVMKQLTKYLSKQIRLQCRLYQTNENFQDTLTKPLSEEATYACDVIFGKDPGMMYPPPFFTPIDQARRVERNSHCRLDPSTHRPSIHQNLPRRRNVPQRSLALSLKSLYRQSIFLFSKTLGFEKTKQAKRYH